MVLKNLRRRNQEFADLAFSYQDSVPMNAQFQAASLPLGPMPDGTMLDGAKLVRSARAVIATEARAIEALHDRIDGRFLRACQLMIECQGRVVVSGMGKSGHIARKIAATLASTGTPALFVHPAEASHGDLGMIGPDDGLIMLSNSGETAELSHVVGHAKRLQIPVVAITSRADSLLAEAATVLIALPKAEEACPLGLAPTTST